MREEVLLGKGLIYFIDFDMNRGIPIFPCLSLTGNTNQRDEPKRCSPGVNGSGGAYAVECSRWRCQFSR